jgi:thiol-disulfide isomerase/thioredoxin
MLVYADWCGHCHQFMPHFDAAAKNSNHSMKAVKVNDTMMSAVNDAITNKNHKARPFKIDGYPSVMLVGQDGNQVSQIEPVKDTTVMTKVMNQSVQLANEAGLIKNSSTPAEESEMNASIRPNNVRISPPKVNSLMASATPDFIANEDMGEREGVSLAPHQSIKKARNNNDMNVVDEPSLAMPPNMNDDHEMENNNGLVKKGGSLYSAMSQSAYTLAAPAALLATAALMMRRNTRKSRRGKHVKKRRSRRRV